MKVKPVLVLLIFTLFSINTYGQKKITWKELTKVYHNEIYQNKSDDKKAISLKDVEGKKITVRGYFLDLGADSMWYMISRFPFENCFFCTGVGPETVIELGAFQNKKSKFKTDDIVTVTGTLFLRKEEGEYFYTLENCTVTFSET